MNNLSRADLNAILAAADAVISAMAGENEDVHPDNTSKMIALWDDLNDRHAPPAVVKALVSELLALREAGKEPVALVDIQSGRPDGNKFALVFNTAMHKLPDEVYHLYAAPQLPAVPVATVDIKRGNPSGIFSINWHHAALSHSDGTYHLFAIPAGD
ncbi:MULTISPECIES: hypothetical protein [unclassified Cedecea]|uniref:hypothetical protein n=1 Tax=unclassified Cedecea TaxID=2649846 RepID=UPI0030186F50